MIFIALIIASIFSFVMYRKTFPELSLQRRGILFFLRLISLWIVLAFLLIPIYKVTKVAWQKPKAVVLLDNSDSMELLQNNKTKSEIINSFLDEIKEDLAKNFEIEYFNFAASLEGNRNNSDLIKTTEELFSQSSNNPSEIFLLSDGYFINNKFAQLRDYPFKINTFSFSNQQIEQKPKFLNVRSNRTTFLNDPTPIELTTNSQGAQNLTIVIKDKDKTLLRKNITETDSNIVKHLLHLKFDKEGLYELSIILQDNKEEFDTAKLVVKVNDDQSNVVILTDSPDWDVKFIKEAIKLDNRFNYRFVTVKNRKLWEANTEISLSELLSDCQLLILNNDNRLLLNTNESDLIKNKVDKGLNLFLIGDIINGLDDYYPVSKSQIDRQYEGKVIPGIVTKNYTTFNDYLQDYQDFPPVKYRYYTLKNRSQEIATMDNMDRSPAITAFKLNETKILHFAVEDFWRFAMRVDKDKYQDFMLNIVQWLSSKSGENFLVSTDKDGYYFGETINFNASILDEKGDFISQKKLKLEVKDDKNIAVLSDFLLWKTDNYSYELNDLKAGNYFYKVTDNDTKQMKEGNFIIFNNSLEQAHLDFNNVALNEISNITNGQNFASEDINLMPELLKREKVSIDLYSEFKILYNNYFLLLVILSFSIELYFRRRWGLL